MHRELLTAEPSRPPTERFVAELRRLLVLSGGQFISVKPLIEAALAVALEGSPGPGTV
jgi:hypothetical protein